MLPLQPGCSYHIYNRGNNGETLFREVRNYRYFLELYARHILPVAETFAYCLMKNHFHLLVRIRDGAQTSASEQSRHIRKPSQAFANFFNAYAKAINKAYGRTGSLFQERFRRIEVTSEEYFTHLVFYIHFNPQKHGFVADFRDWPWSSYHTLSGSQSTKLERARVLALFGDQAGFAAFHQGTVEKRSLQQLVDGDEDTEGLHDLLVV